MKNRALLISGVILFLDQFAKYLVSGKMTPGQSIPIIPGIFHLTYIKNKGSAFGLSFLPPALLIVVGFLVSGGIIWYWMRHPPGDWKAKLGLAFILGGSVGNLWDRLYAGAVTDFLDFRIWPVFNLADTFITLGALLLAISFLTSLPGGPLPKRKG